MKLRHKVFLIYAFLAVIPMIAITNFSYLRYRQATYQRMTDFSDTLAENARTQINDNLRSLRRALDFLTFYSDENEESMIETMRSFAERPGEYTSYEILQAQKYCDPVFQNLMYTNAMIRGIYLILPDGLIIGNANEIYSRINHLHNCCEDQWYEKTVALSGSPYISTFTAEDMFTDDKPSVYLAKSVSDIYTHELLGVILMDCDAAFLNLDSANGLPGLALISVMNSTTSETIYSNVDSLPAGQMFTDNLHKAELAIAPLVLTTSFHYDTLYREFNPSGMLILLIALVCIAIELILCFFVTRGMIRPVESLSWSMSRQKKNGLKFISPYMKRTDEIGTLYNEYARMLEELNDSIHKNYRSKLILLDAQMKSLEARINSHFLFNTLESINSMAEIAEEKDIADMSLALGNMFRYAIKTKSELVTLADELKHTMDYVSIQQIRFGGRFRLVTDIPQDLMQEEVLKLILQPLVENALYHGLNYCTAGDTISVTARRSSDTLLLTVSDNGQGMAPETLARVRNDLAREASFTELGHRSSQSIGLTNIHTRIELYYGSGYGLAVESTEGNGTVITIRLPLIRAAAHTEVH